jgi:hypothetical protein
MRVRNIRINNSTRNIILTTLGTLAIEYGISYLIEKLDEYDSDGFNKEGYDKAGYNIQGYDKDGFNRKGFNKSGFDRNGYNRAGFDRSGYDWEGYAENRYNGRGVDRYGNTCQYYYHYLNKLYNLKEEAFAQLKNEQYVYALLDIRLILEESMVLIIGHSLGQRGLGDGLVENMRICEKNDLLNCDSDFYNRIHGVRKICNPNMHSISSTENITHGQVHFAIMQTKELLKVVESNLVA